VPRLQKPSETFSPGVLFFLNLYIFLFLLFIRSWAPSSVLVWVLFVLILFFCTYIYIPRPRFAFGEKTGYWGNVTMVLYRIQHFAFCLVLCTQNWYSGLPSCGRRRPSTTFTVHFTKPFPESLFFLFPYTFFANVQYLLGARLSISA